MRSKQQQAFTGSTDNIENPGGFWRNNRQLCHVTVAKLVSQRGAGRLISFLPFANEFGGIIVHADPAGTKRIVISHIGQRRPKDGWAWQAKIGGQHDSAIVPIALRQPTKDSPLWLACNSDAGVSLYELTADRVILKVRIADTVGATFSGDGKTLAVCTRTGKVKVFPLSAETDQRHIGNPRSGKVYANSGCRVAAGILAIDQRGSKLFGSMLVEASWRGPAGHGRYWRPYFSVLASSSITGDLNVAVFDNCRNEADKVIPEPWVLGVTNHAPTSYCDSGSAKEPQNNRPDSLSRQQANEGLFTTHLPLLSRSCGLFVGLGQQGICLFPDEAGKIVTYKFTATEASYATNILTLDNEHIVTWSPEHLEVRALRQIIMSGEPTSHLLSNWKPMDGFLIKAVARVPLKKKTGFRLVIYLAKKS
jgi:hypothetical protein